MPAPPSQLTALWHGLKTAPTLAGWVEVLLGAKNYTPNAGVRRIVLIPIGGPLETAKHTDDALRDVKRKVIAHLWASDIDELLELEQRFIQALDWQASPQPWSPSPPPPGQYWITGAEAWDTDPDKNKSGEAMEIDIYAEQSIDKIPQKTGEVDSVVLTPQTSTTLTAPMTSTDTTASVASTAGFAQSGILSIDAERIRYTGITATTFYGLIRGVNLTFPASHAQNATVTVS